MTSNGAEPVAIIGLSLRVPGAETAEQFWRNLVDGVESGTVFSRAELAARGVPASTLDDPAFVPVTPVLDRLEYFDAGLFGLTAHEADLADPQQRLFLEHAHTALLDAGCDPARYDGEIGVYAGSNADLYQWLNIRRNPTALAGAGELRVALGNKPDYLASTVSYRLNLRGPSLAVHTACSSSLVAIHLAAEALRNGECDAALAGGVCVELPHGVGYVADEGYTSSDGHCRPFDARADGTVYGSGVGVVLLKRLVDAQADGDNIRALLIGDAVNNDGATKVAFTAPSVGGQLEVVVQALAAAGVAPRTVSYVEAHGTGTVLGDSIEVAALTAAYGQGSTERGWCGIGSVKSNIGHLSPASGVVGLIKTVLALEHRLIPPSINIERPNPEIGFDASPFYVVSTLTRWEPDEHGPRRAGVSSFGLGGTNAHVILQEAPRPVSRADSPSGAQLLQVSAATPTALTTACARLATHLTEHPELDLRDVAHTLRLGRSAYPHRAAVVAVERGQAVAALTDPKRRAVDHAVLSPRVAFLFSGLGTQYAGMGARLAAAEPVFAAAVDECAAVLRAEWGEGLRELIFTGGATAEAKLAEPARMQPALFTIEYALAVLWRHWGVTPAAMIGHSIGEFVAATVAGVFELPDALRVVVARGRLIESGPEGRMLAVQRGADEVSEWLPAGVSIAVVNGPGTCVLAGAPKPVIAFAETLRERGVGCTALRAPYAIHSPLLDPVRDEFAAVVAGVPRQAPMLPFWSTVTAEPITAEQAIDPTYWADQLCRPVRFGAAVASLAATGGSADWVLLECGPGRQLSGLARLSLPPDGRAPLRSLPAPGEKLTDSQTCYEAAGRLWAAGVPVRLGQPDQADRPVRVSLPGYPYERTRHWIDPTPAVAVAEPAPVGPDAGTDGAVIQVPVWRQLPRTPVGPSPDRCLVFVADERAAALAVRLRDSGSEVTVVRPGPGFAVRPDGYLLRPAEVADYQQLVMALGNNGRPGRIVHAWALAGEPAGGDPTAVWAAQRLGYLSLLALIEALPAGPVELDVITMGAEDVTGGDLRRPEQATVAGVVRVAPLEQPGWAVHWVDTDPDESTVDSLAAELARPDRPEAVALRWGRRWSRTFESVTPQSPVTHDGSVAAGGVGQIRPGGRYLITGGLGRIGSAVAEDLARHRARLVLLSRTAVPPRARWAELSNHDAGPVGHAIEAIRHLEQAGAEVRHVVADVTDVAQLRAVRAEIMAVYGGLDGIVHAARLPDTGLVAASRHAEAAAELSPKMAGALALGEVFGDLPLDFAVLSSSVTALAGGLGRADDSAANAFLDAYARSAHGWRTRLVSINWGAWREEGVPDHDGIEPAAAVAAWHRVLAADLGEQVAVGAYPVAAVAEHERRIVASMAAGARVPAMDSAAGGDLTGTVARIWSEVLGASEVGQHDDFFQLGGTSLVAAQLVLRVRQAVGARLSMRVLFEGPTVASMVTRIEALRAAAPARETDTPIPRLLRPGRPA